MTGAFRHLRLLPVFAVGLLLLGCAPEAKKAKEVAPVREVDLSELERMGDRLFVRGETEPFSGWMVEHYAESGLKSRSAIWKGQLNGRSEGWHPNGQLQVRETFREGVAHGTRTRWFPDGSVESEAEIVDGKLHGIFRRWHPNGELAERTEMKDGEANGISIGFFPSGYLRARVVLENGNVVERRLWKDGEARGEALADHRAAGL